MKKIAIISSFALMGIFAGTSLFGQCEPDIVNCMDVDEPGQICPLFLPEAIVNAYYEEVVTVIPPSEYTLGTLTIYLDYLLIDSVGNLPDGLSYAANAERFYADTAYCVSIFGTPTQKGIDTLHIYVTPFLWINDVSTPFTQVVNDTSVVIAVVETSGFDPNQYTDFHILPNKPNPFSDVTSIGFYTPFDDRIELLVYNILGIQVHREEMGVPPGEYNFEFNGQSLQPGTYFYRVNSHEQYQTGKFIKIKR
jgi:hypothetical protein